MKRRIITLFLAGTLVCSLVSTDVCAAQAVSGAENTQIIQNSEKTDIQEDDPEVTPPAEPENTEKEPAGDATEDNDHKEDVPLPEETSPNEDDTDKPQGNVGSDISDEPVQDTVSGNTAQESGVQGPQKTDAALGSMTDTLKLAGSLKPYTYEIEYAKPCQNTVSGIAFRTILDKALVIIGINEGNDTTVNKNDEGALSLGRMQWHGVHALKLMRLIVSEDNQKAYNILGEDLYKEITAKSTGWGTRTLNTSEASRIKKLLGTQESKRVQVKLSDSFVTGYLNNGIKLGIVNAPALVYYADVENQRGYGGSSACAKFAYNLKKNWKNVTLNELHIATICEAYSWAGSNHYLANAKNRDTYIVRRRRTYGFAAGLGWKFCSSGDSVMPYGSVWQSPYTGAAWLQRALNTYQNAGLSIDGSYGPATRSAVEKFQKSAGLETDGYAGPGTTDTLILKLYYAASSGGGTPVIPPDNGGSSVGTKTAAISLTKSSYAVNDNKGTFSLGAKSNHSEKPLTYKSSNTAVASVDSRGKVTVRGAGSAIITVNQAKSAHYKAAAAKTVKIKVYSTNPSSYKAPTMTLSSGRSMPKSSVQWLQAFLTTFGFTKEVIDGKWDSTTLSSVKKFQKAVGLSADGSVGPATRTVMSNLLSVKKAGLKASASSGTDRNTVKWSRVPGAAGYYVYRKTVGGSWSRIKTVTSGSTVSYADKSAKAGTVYYYCARAYRNNGSVSALSAYKASKAAVRLTKPGVTVNNYSTSVKLSWKKASYAGGYVIYRRTGTSGSYKKLKTVSSSQLSYTDKSVSRGITYYYYVKAYKKQSGVTAYGPKSSTVKGKRRA